MLAIVLGVFFLVAAYTKSIHWLEMGYRLCFGWIHRLWQTVPEITFNPELFLNGLGSFLFAAVVLHLTLAAFRNHLHPSAQGWKISWTGSVMACFTLLFAICISSSGIGTHLVRLFQEPLAQPSLDRAEFDDFRGARILAVEFRLSDADPMFTRAKNWHELEKRSESRFRPLEKLALIHASARLDVPEVWTFLGQVGDPELENLLVFCTPRAYSNEGRLVIFSNGEVKRCTPEEYDKALEQWHAVRSKNKTANPHQTGGRAP